MARCLLDDATFGVRAVTRNPQQEAANELKKRGAEVVKADLDDVQSLEAALTGAHGAFLVTDFWDHLSEEKEVAQVETRLNSPTAAFQWWGAEVKEHG